MSLDKDVEYKSLDKSMGYNKHLELMQNKPVKLQCFIPQGAEHNEHIHI